jgi:hypothetical protein
VFVLPGPVVLVAVGVLVLVGVFVGVLVLVGVLVGVFVLPGPVVLVAVGVWVLVGVCVAVLVGVLVRVSVGVWLGVFVGVLVGVLVLATVVLVGVLVGVFVSVEVAVGVGVLTVPAPQVTVKAACCPLAGRFAVAFQGPPTGTIRFSISDEGDVRVPTLEPNAAFVSLPYNATDVVPSATHWSVRLTMGVRPGVPAAHPPDLRSMAEELEVAPAAQLEKSVSRLVAET